MSSNDQMEYSAETMQEIASLASSMQSESVTFTEDMNRQVRRIAEHAHAMSAVIFSMLYQRMIHEGQTPSTEAFRELEAGQIDKQK